MELGCTDNDKCNSIIACAVSALQFSSFLPDLPPEFSVTSSRNADVLDFLQFVFGFQKQNISNQREHIAHLLANEQSRLGALEEFEPKLDGAAIHKVFLKALDNYICWCNYLCIQRVWSSLDTVSKEKKLSLISLYFFDLG